MGSACSMASSSPSTTVELLVELLDVTFQSAHRRDRFVGVLAFLLELADRLAGLVALLLERLELYQNRSALLIQTRPRLDDRRLDASIFETAAGGIGFVFVGALLATWRYSSRVRSPAAVRRDFSRSDSRFLNLPQDSPARPSPAARSSSHERISPPTSSPDRTLRVEESWSSSGFCHGSLQPLSVGVVATATAFSMAVWSSAQRDPSAAAEEPLPGSSRQPAVLLATTAAADRGQRRQAHNSTGQLATPSRIPDRLPGDGRAHTRKRRPRGPARRSSSRSAVAMAASGTGTTEGKPSCIAYPIPGIALRSPERQLSLAWSLLRPRHCSRPDEWLAVVGQPQFDLRRSTARLASPTLCLARSCSVWQPGRFCRTEP